MSLAFKEILTFNSLSSHQDSQDVEELELFQLVNVSVLLEFTPSFTNLKELCINYQKKITSLEGINHCPKLQKLWVADCSLSEVHNDLAMCAELKLLNLSGNNLCSMGCVTTLLSLEKLWLCDNKLRDIEGISKLKNVTNLWIARNYIDKLGTCLDGLGRLEELNISQNRIGSFRELINLSRLPSLKVLFLNDPHFGGNPVCSLSNYQTYVLCHLTQVKVFDGLIIDEEAKVMTEATFLKKRMYYNMRIKTLKRNTTNVIRKAVECKQTMISKINMNFNILLRKKKDVDREIEEAEHAQTVHSTEVLAQLKEKQTALQECITLKMDQIADINGKCNQMKDEVRQIAEDAVQYLLMELETGGNIRLVESHETDSWYSVCDELFMSRTRTYDYKKFGVGDIKMTRVMKIHNRFLKNRFEERSAAVKSSEEECETEYMFFHYNDKDSPSTLDSIVKDGFLPGHHYRSTEGNSGIPLHRCLYGNELDSKLFDGSQKGKVIIAKVCLGKVDNIPDAKVNLASDRAFSGMRGTSNSESLLMRSDSTSSIGSDGSVSNRRKRKYSLPLEQQILEDDNNQLWEAAPENTGPGISPNDFPGYHSVYRETRGKNADYREYFAFDRCLVLPEYIVEFDYVTLNDKLLREMGRAEDTSENMKLGMLSTICEEPLTKQELNDLGPLLSPLLTYLSGLSVHERADKRSLETEKLSSHAINLPPVLSQRDKVSNLTETYVLNWSSSPNPAAVTYLNFHACSLTELTGLSACCNLKTLVVSFNELHSLSGLTSNVELTRLEVGFNLIKTIQGLETLSKLETLELNNNLLYRLEDLETLKAHNPAIRTLDLRGNALCDMNYYKSEVLSKIPMLVVHDGYQVTEKDRQSGSYEQLSLSKSIIEKYSVKRALVDNQKDNADWYRLVENLEINRARIRKIENLSRLVNLRKISFVENEITRMEGFEGCPLLEELSLESNLITQIEGLQCCIYLKKLDLAHNKLTKIEGLESLVNLTALSLEDNEIRSLEGLGKLSCLMELYIANNQLSTQGEIQHIRELPKLIILDLLGNPVSREPAYRLYTVFYLKKLKVLDGIGVDVAEQAASKERFAGKLTVEFLAEKVGNKYYEHLGELDLSSCRLRDIEMNCLSGDHFSGLRELNLGNNNLTDLNGLTSLPTLQVLRLNRNRIESLTSKVVDGIDTGLKALPNLEVLQLGYNRIKDIAALNLFDVPNLKVLFLQGNELSFISGLEHCVNLTELVLDQNKFRSLEDVNEGVSSLKNLRALRIEENSIRSLGYLGSLVKLHSLYLGMNRLTDLAELEKLSSIPFLLELSLVNNPITRKQQYRTNVIRAVPTLKFVDGKEITAEERERVEIANQPETHLPAVLLSSTLTNLVTESKVAGTGGVLSITGKMPSAVKTSGGKDMASKTNSKKPNGGKNIQGIGVIGYGGRGSSSIPQPQRTSEVNMMNLVVGRSVNNNNNYLPKLASVKKKKNNMEQVKWQLANQKKIHEQHLRTIQSSQRQPSGPGQPITRRNSSFSRHFN